MSELDIDLQEALGRLVVVLQDRLHQYEGEFESLACSLEAPPYANTRHTQYYLARLQQELNEAETVASAAKAIRTAALLIHVSHTGEPYWAVSSFLNEQHRPLLRR